MKTTNKLISILIAVAMLLTMAPISAFAAETVASGTCGTNVSYVLDSDGVLTVSGSGAMKDYRYVAQSPFTPFREDIKSIIIEDGVTSVGNLVFYGCTNLTSLTIKGTLDKIGNNAFNGCNAITEITYLSATVPEFANGTSTFTSSDIKVTVPENYPIDNFAGLTNLSYTASTGSGETTLPTYAVSIIQRNTGVAVKTVTSDGVVAEEATYGKDLTVELEITGEGTLDEVYVHHIYIGDNRFDLGDEDCPVTLNELTLTIPGEYVTEKIEIDAGIMLKVSVDMAGGYLKNTSSTQWNAPVDGVVTMTKEWARYGVGGMWYFEEDFARVGYILVDMVDSEGNSYAPNYQLVLSKDLELTLVWEECTEHNYVDGICEHCGKADHTHSFVYTAGGGRIIATCVAGDCPLENGIGGTFTISAPADLYADGTTAKEVVIDNQLAESVDYTVTYSTEDGKAPKTAGTYTASVTIADATATLEFTLLSYAASVTAKDGNEVGTYKTFAEAVTAAEASEDSTITLLDDVTVNETVEISSGKFTLDLNGKTLLCETSRVLYLCEDADLTIKDSGKDGTIESKLEYYHTVNNRGTLTVESGTVKGDVGIDNNGTLKFNGGTVEAVTYSAIENGGTAYVYDGELNSEESAGITNSTGGTLYVYGGKIDGISNSDTAYISGGTIDRDDYAALNLLGGTVEVTGGSFSGTDDADGYYSGIPYGERTVSYTEGATLTLKGGKFPGGFVVDDTTANALLAEGYAFYGEDGGKITVADDATKIDGYVQVKEHFAASVTAKDGSEVGTYKTFAEAVTAAEASEDSTITLLDDVTVNETVEISSGKFTLDLNGKTLLCETSRVLYLCEDADLTIKDSGKDGTIESKAETYQAIWNKGTLTVESGTVKGDSGIFNTGTLTVNGGAVEAVTYSAIKNGGTTYVYDGELKSEKEAGITNSTGGTLYIYGGEMSGKRSIINHDTATAYISGGKFKGNAFAALDLYGGTVEVTGGSFSGTDDAGGYYSGTPYGEWTVNYSEGVTLTLKGGEFPNGFVVDDTTANTLTAAEYYYKDADGKVITVADDAKIINGYVKVSKGADFATDAVVTLEKTEFTYTGEEITPAVVVKVGGKTLTEGKDYTLTFANNVNAGTAAVTVKATDDSVYTGETIAEFTILKAESAVDAAPAANELTYNGEAQALVAAGTAENGTMVYSLDGEEYSEEIPAATNAGEYTVYYKVIGDSNHNDTEAETLTVTVKAKDISDATITLGDALTYNGEEQTQTVSEFTIPAGLEVTYTVSGNKATNVGVYLLTVTGTGNFTGEAKLTFEIAPDTSKIDALTVDNVTSASKADIEAVKAQIDNASTEYADDETKAEYKAIADKCDELLAKINATAEEIKRVDEAVKGYDEDTVKSTDEADLEQLKEDIEALKESGNVTEDEIAALEEKLEAAEILTEKIEETEAQIEEIKGIENNYNPEDVTSDDKAAIEEAIAEIEAVNPDNLTEEQKAEYDEIKAEFDALLEEIEKAGAEVDALGTELEMFDEERVTIFHEDEIEALKTKIDELLADDNMGEAEKAKLEEYKAQCDNLIEIINTPAEYFSMRLFWFVWDALNWLVNHFVFIYNWIF